MLPRESEREWPTSELLRDSFIAAQFGLEETRQRA